MFLKPFKVKSSNNIRASERRKLKENIRQQFSLLSDEDILTIFPDKEEISAIKIRTSKDSNVLVYCMGKNPVFFEIEKHIFPTVYTAWAHPGIAMVMVTHPPVFSRISGGADLMLPGVNAIFPVDQPYEKDVPCLVALNDNRAAVAVGKTALSSNDIAINGMRGKGVIVLHCYGDCLWVFGDKSELPSLSYLEPVIKGLEENLNVCASEEPCPTPDCPPESVSEAPVSPSETPEEVSSRSQQVEEEALQKDGEGDDLTKGEESKDANEQQEDDQQEDDWKADMDLLLEYCFLQALLGAKKIELPVLISSFTKQHLFPICPEGFSIDVKKSRHKKMSKFLLHMQQQGIIEVKEMSKGVDGLTGINFDHEILVGFSKSKFSKELRALRKKDATAASKSKDEKAEVVELFAVSGKTSVFFKLLNVGKGTVMSASDVRSAVTEYVKSNQLVCKENSRFVVLDPHLEDVVLAKGSNESKLPWDALINRFLAQMNSCHEIRVPGCQPVVRKGKFEPIDVTVAKRMGNKKVTLIKGLEQFGVDLKQFAQVLQHAAASSTAVDTLPGKMLNSQVMVQGSQLKHVADVLASFNIPLKYVIGLEKASKGKR